MRHLFVTQDFPPDRGGMARRHFELARHFPGFEMAVSTVAHPRGASFDAGQPFAIDRRPFDFAHAKLITNQLRWARALVAERDAYEVLHCGNVRPVGYAVWWAARRTGVPYLVYVNGGDVLRERDKTRGWLKRAAARRIFGDAAGVVANSPWTAGVTEEVMRRAGVTDPPPVAAIDLGTDPAHFRPDRDGGALRARFALGDHPVVLTVARLVPHKGQDAGIRALAALAPELPNLRYLLVGEGHDEARLRALAASLGVADRTVFAGVLSDDEIAEAYATATVYLGASRLDRGINVEGFGISFIEAGASGTPSVAGDSGGVRAAVRDGETGLVVPPQDLDAVAGALRALLLDAPRREAMGRAARAAVESHYNWDRVARETRDFAERVAGARGSRR
ncbi:MAG TPA: glycosyltransferase family 4 protein [Gemmatimonadaceae bacterium]|nr:glycosyltransferase family 4 protein [Gemmatimonadaceae bacterium]